MLKFLRKRNKQPVEPLGQAENATDEEGSADELQPTMDYLEEVLKPLFERIQPTAPEEYVGMYNSIAFVSVILVHRSQVVRTRIHQPPLSGSIQHEHFPKTFPFFKERFKNLYTSSCFNCESC